MKDEEDRQKIKNLMEQIKIPDDMGFIVRTAGINRTKQEILRDYQLLMRLWKEIYKKASSINAPSTDLSGNRLWRAQFTRLFNAGN